MSSSSCCRFIFILGPIAIVLFGAYRTVYRRSFPTFSTVSEIDRTSLEADDSRCISYAYLKAVQATIIAEKKSIWSFWDVRNFPLFLSTFHIPTKSWEIQKYKFIKLLLDDRPNKKFVVGFSGSSVTAGRDNYFYEAYPQIFHNTMAPVFGALHINLTTRNHALGNNPCYAYGACIPTHLGDDLDILTWEQSWNCGRDPKPLESFVRSAQNMQNKPTVMFLRSETPMWLPKACFNITTNTSLSSNPARPVANSSVTDSTTTVLEIEKQLLSLPIKAVADKAGLLETFAFLGANKENNKSSLVSAYGGLAPMGQSLHPIQIYKCRGPYSANFSSKSPLLGGKIGGGSAWHPGRLGHKLRGDIIAYFLLEILNEALEAIKQTTGSRCEVPISHLPSSPILVFPVAAQRPPRGQQPPSPSPDDAIEEHLMIAATAKSSLGEPPASSRTTPLSTSLVVVSSPQSTTDATTLSSATTTTSTGGSNKSTTTTTTTMLPPPPPSSTSSLGGAPNVSIVPSSTTNSSTEEEEEDSVTENEGSNNNISKQSGGRLLISSAGGSTSTSSAPVSGHLQGASVVVAAAAATTVAEDDSTPSTSLLGAPIQRFLSLPFTQTFFTQTITTTVSGSSTHHHREGEGRESLQLLLSNSTSTATHASTSTSTSITNDSGGPHSSILARLMAATTFSFTGGIVTGTGGSVQKRPSSPSSSFVRKLFSTVITSASFSVEQLFHYANTFLDDVQAADKFPEEPLYCDKDVCGSEPQCYTDYLPRMSHALGEQLVGPRDEDWTLELSFLDKEAVAKAEQNNLGYIDRKLIYLSHRQNASLSMFVTTVTKASSLWLCESQKGVLTYPSNIGDLDVAADVYVDKNVAAAVARAAEYQPKKVEIFPLIIVKDQCYRTISTLPAGHHVISVVQKYADKQINLAYVLTW